MQNAYQSPMSKYLRSEHLPKELQLQKIKLFSSFQETRKKKQKTSWRLQNGEYSLFVNDQCVMPCDSNESNEDTRTSDSSS